LYDILIILILILHRPIILQLTILSDMRAAFALRHSKISKLDTGRSWGQGMRGSCPPPLTPPMAVINFSSQVFAACVEDWPTRHPQSERYGLDLTLLAAWQVAPSRGIGSGRNTTMQALQFKCSMKQKYTKYAQINTN